MTLLSEPVTPTAQNMPKVEDQQTSFQVLSAALVLAIQVIPSEDVMTLFPVPSCDTAQNSPSSLDQQIPTQLLALGADLKVQLTPSGDVITTPDVPAVAANNLNSGDQQIPL